MHEPHYAMALKATDYDSDGNMTRNAVHHIRNVDSDGDSVATDDSRILRTYNSFLDVYDGFTDDVEDEEEESVPPHRRSSIRSLEAPIFARIEQWLLRNQLRMIPYSPLIFKNPNKLRVPPRLSLASLKTSDMHGWRQGWTSIQGTHT